MNKTDQFDSNDYGNRSNDKFESLNSLAKKLASFAPASLQHLQEDLEKNMRTGLESGLRKMNLVTREEFDVQTAVLQRTREKLEALEKIVKEMENRA